MKNKTKRILTWMPSVLAAWVITMGAIMKLASAPQLVELYSKTGLLPYMKVLGVTEIVFIGLFLWPRSMKIGFLLLTAYFGGAMAVELSHGNIFLFPAALLTLIWIGMYLREPSLFVRPVNMQKRLMSFD